jgi:hypothetical protein
MQKSIDMTSVYSAFILLPLKEAKIIAPGLHPGLDSTPRESAICDKVKDRKT